MTAKRTFVSVKVTFDGIHNWENAPHFLRHPHQHRFQVGIKVQTIPGDNSRSLEFFDLKAELHRAIDQAFPEVDTLGIRHLGGHSTESISDLIYGELPRHITERHLWIEVNEDDTQGSESEYEPQPNPRCVDGTVIPGAEIQQRVAELGRQIAADYADKESFVIVCLLKGSFVFVADLLRHIDHHGVEIEFLQLRSYEGTERGEIQVLGALPRLKGRDVLVVDDICDSGETVRKAVALLEAAEAASVSTAVLLARNTAARRSVDYCGFVLDSEVFVVGYGMDVDEKLRQLRDLRAAS